MDYDKHCKIYFGEYCEVHGDQEPTNSTKTITYRAIDMVPTVNLQGSYEISA